MSTITNVTISALHVEKEANFNASTLNITHNFEPNWSEEQAYGKMDPIATYSHTGRTMSVDMMMMAMKASEAIELQRNVDNLIQMNYPLYASSGGSTYIQSPPFFEVTTLREKAYKSVKGYITGLEIEPGNNNDVAPLVIDGIFVQRQYNISFSMTVLHEGVPGFGAAGLFEEGGSYIFIPPPGGDPVETDTEGGVSALADTLGFDGGSAWNSVKNALGAKPTEGT